MKKYKLMEVSAILIALLFGTVACQTAFAQTKKKVTYYSVKAGTKFRVRLEENLTSKTARIGDTFSTTTVDPVYSSGGIQLVPSGSTIVGRVSAVQPAGKDGKPGTIDVSFTSIRMPNKRRAAINGTLVSLDEDGTTSDNEGTATGKKTSRRNVKFIGGGAAGGAVIGGIAGGGKGAAIGAGIGALGGLIGKKVSKGSEAEVKEGTEFGIYLNQKISLPRY